MLLRKSTFCGVGFGIDGGIGVAEETVCNLCFKIYSPRTFEWFCALNVEVTGVRLYHRGFVTRMRGVFLSD